MSDHDLDLTPLTSVSPLKLDKSPIDAWGDGYYNPPTKVQKTIAAAQASTEACRARVKEEAEPATRVVPSFAQPKPTEKRRIAEDPLCPAMEKAVNGLQIGTGVMITYGTDGYPKSAVERHTCDCAGDVVITDPHNSPSRRRLEIAEDTPQCRNRPSMRTMSAAMAEMQRTGNYPTLEDQIAGRGPLGMHEAPIPAFIPGAPEKLGTDWINRT